MTAEIIQFMPKANPKLAEAKVFAAAMNNGKACYEPSCTMETRGFCTTKGCLLVRESIPYGGQGIDGMDLYDNAPSEMNVGSIDHGAS